jgi:hypothetical protein
MDYNFWHTALGHALKAAVIRKLYEEGYLIPNYPSNFTFNLCALSKSKNQVQNLVVFKSTEVLE